LFALTCYPAYEKCEKIFTCMARACHPTRRVDRLGGSVGWIGWLDRLGR